MRHLARNVIAAVTLGMALALPLSLVLSGTADATTLTSGNVTLTGTADAPGGGTVASGKPYSSGEDIDITITANSTLDLTNLEANGATGEEALHVEECSDLDGSPGNLPTTATNNCDGSTLISSNSLNSDGSFTLDDYEVLALPDSLLGEKSTQTPVCGLYPNECVLYLGVDQLNFSLPKLFSAPFQIQPNGTDSGANPGDGTPEAPWAIALPLIGLGVGGSVLYLRRRHRARVA